MGKMAYTIEKPATPAFAIFEVWKTRVCGTKGLFGAMGAPFLARCVREKWGFWRGLKVNSITNYGASLVLRN
jgi:hypothetical protein